MTEKQQYRQDWREGSSKQKEEYLTRASKLPGVKKYKKQSFDILDVKEGDYILDIGCGTGEDTQLLAPQVGNAGKVIGVDINQGLVDKARERVKGTNLPLEFYPADVYNLNDFDSASFDGCRSDRAFQHLEDPKQALIEILRVTRVGGRIVICDPDWETRQVVDVPNQEITREATNYWRDTRKNGRMGSQLAKLFKECGLTNITTTRVSITGRLTDFDLANEILALQASVEGARDHPDYKVSAEDATRWLNYLKETELEGRFFGNLFGFIVSGQKSG